MIYLAGVVFRLCRGGSVLRDICETRPDGLGQVLAGTRRSSGSPPQRTEVDLCWGLDRSKTAQRITQYPTPHNNRSLLQLCTAVSAPTKQPELVVIHVR